MIAKLLPAPGTPRILMFAALVDRFGNGAYLSTSALFLTRSVGLTPAQVALGLSAAALVGMALTTPMGYLVDRLGPKAMQISALLTLAAAFGALTLVHQLWSFVLVACVIAAGDSTVKAANGALIAGAVPPDQRIRTRAFIRSTNNAGVALGTLAGSLPLLLDSRAGYLAVLLGNAGTFLVAAAIVSHVDRVARTQAPTSGPRLTALRDRPFLTFALVDGLMAALYNDILTLALPLWLIAATDAPVALVSVALLINTLGGVLLQVWASRGAHTAADAIAVTRRGALVVAAACALFALTSGQPSWLVAALVIGAATVHVLGELWLSTATWAVVFDLAPESGQGQYQAAYLTGRQLGNLAAPPLLMALVIGLGAPGWIGLAAIFAAGGLASPHVIRWGLRRRRPAVPAASRPLAASLR